MQRRPVLASAALALLLPSLSVSASVDTRRRAHRLALAASKREIQRIGALHRAGRWQDTALKVQLRAQAQVYAAHYRALAVLA